MKCSLPGEFLATEEEFSKGENTFEENGDIFSDSIGKPSEDTKRKVISIAKAKVLAPIAVGSIVFGIVNLVRTNSVSIELSSLKSASERQVVGSSYAMLPVRNVSREYIENLKQEFKIGDFVKAKVSEAKPWGIDLRTNEAELGVIKAFCSKCRHPLQLSGRGLKCTSCGNSETRKLSSEYESQPALQETAEL
ncbi:MAG: exosome complex RNA-binding protein Csl4 [Candidatus ainarchaeum sp.]|nr:exosome complex RNA-binding protein Csl4 [Candidatus ainarchaeum sp.]